MNADTQLILDRLDGIDGRLDGIDGRLDGIDGRLDGIDGRFESLEGKMTAFEYALQNQGKKLDALTVAVAALGGLVKIVEGIDTNVNRLGMQVAGLTERLDADAAAE